MHVCEKAPTALSLSLLLGSVLFDEGFPNYIIAKERIESVRYGDKTNLEKGSRVVF